MRLGRTCIGMISGIACLVLTACGPEDGQSEPQQSTQARGYEKIRVGAASKGPQVSSGDSSTSASVTEPDGTVQMAKIASGLDEQSLLDGPIPPASSGEPDVVGAFRFLCAPGHLGYDDPIVMPGQPGKFHLHQFFGNTATDAHSTYDSLRTTGDSTCLNALNRSAYWQPAMLQEQYDGTLQVVVPDFHNIYYKRRPTSDPYFAKTGTIPKDIPRGLRFIFGWQPGDTGSPAKFKCLSPDANSNVSPDWRKTMREALNDCSANGGGKLDISVTSPPCWDGKNLDSTDHRSHMSYMQRDESTGWVSKCPASHPYALPVYTNQAIYSVLPSDRPETWHLSSDHMAPDMPPGYTFHTDYFMAWEDTTLSRWMRACIDKLLSCASGNLGDGQIMKRGRRHQEIMARGPQRLPLPDK